MWGKGEEREGRNHLNGIICYRLTCKFPLCISHRLILLSHTGQVPKSFLRNVPTTPSGSFKCMLRKSTNTQCKTVIPDSPLYQCRILLTLFIMQIILLICIRICIICNTNLRPSKLHKCNYRNHTKCVQYECNLNV